MIIPDGWVIAHRNNVEAIEIGDRFIVTPDFHRNVCENCRDPDGLMFSWIVRGINRVQHTFSDSAGGIRSLPASLESIPCPACNPRVRTEWLELHCGLMGIGLEGKDAMSLRLGSFIAQDGQHEAKAAAIELLQELPHPKTWALFFGNNGTGKTHLLMCLTNACRVANVWAHYTTSENILRALRETYDDRAIRSTDDVQSYYEQAPVLIVDEMHRIKWTEWAGEKLFAILENRHTSGKATWFGSNKTPTELQDHCDELRSIVSRISAGTLVAMTGKDWRQAVFNRWTDRKDLG